MKKFFLLLFLSCFILGCSQLLGYKHAEMPKIEIPKKPDKPQIKTVIIKQNDDIYVCYSVEDSLKLYKFLLEKDVYEEKLIFRIEEMNKLIEKFGKARK